MAFLKTTVNQNLAYAVLAFAILFVFTSSSFVSNSYNNASSTTQSCSANPTYVWLFGYIGNTFYPKSELGISTSKVLNMASNLSSAAGGPQNLVILTAVDEIPATGGTISGSSNISAIKSYVADLHKYACAVYGRLDFYQFNLTALPGTAYGNCVGGSFTDYNCPIYNQTRLYIDTLGLNGIWFDHDVFYYDQAGNLTYNWLMQNLTKMVPSAKFILNETPAGAKNGYITQLPGFSWENQTYVSPSPPAGSLTLSPKKLQTLYAAFPGHVIAHLDAEGPPKLIGSSSSEPMAIFAALNTTQETTVLDGLVYNGGHAPIANESYVMVIPILGAWTFNGKLDCTLEPNSSVSCVKGSGSNYHGFLYNGFSTGKNARNTARSFQEIFA